MTHLQLHGVIQHVKFMLVGNCVPKAANRYDGMCFPALSIIENLDDYKELCFSFFLESNAAGIYIVKLSPST